MSRASTVGAHQTCTPLAYMAVRSRGMWFSQQMHIANGQNIVVGKDTHQCAVQGLDARADGAQFGIFFRLQVELAAAADPLAAAIICSRFMDRFGP